MYATPTFQGSRNGGIIAQAWATLMYQGTSIYEIHSALAAIKCAVVFTGQDKYRAAAKKLHKLHQRLLEGVRNTPGLRVSWLLFMSLGVPFDVKSFVPRLLALCDPGCV